MDIWTKEKRSKVMALIRSKNTKPERIVRSILHRMGLRFRLHRKNLPGSPDIVLPKHHAVILVHGCFWHFHKGCRDGRIPATNVEKWRLKLERNVARDKRIIKSLKMKGWRVFVVWECETRKNLGLIEGRVRCFLK